MRLPGTGKDQECTHVPIQLVALRLRLRLCFHISLILSCDTLNPAVDCAALVAACEEQIATLSAGIDWTAPTAVGSTTALGLPYSSLAHEAAGSGDATTPKGQAAGGARRGGSRRDAASHVGSASPSRSPRLASVRSGLVSLGLSSFSGGLMNGAGGEMGALPPLAGRKRDSSHAGAMDTVDDVAGGGLALDPLLFAPRDVKRGRIAPRRPSLSLRDENNPAASGGSLACDAPLS